MRALDHLDLDIEAGELICLLGPSGCGKTTALRVLAGLEDADDGQVLVGGRDVTAPPANKRDMGMVFQEALAVADRVGVMRSLRYPAG